MRKRLPLVGFTLIALAVLVAAITAFGGEALADDPSLATPAEADLSGGAVVPTQGDPDGTGHIDMLLYPSKNKICYRITVAGIESATAAHLHRGTAGEVGPAVLRLRVPRETVRECRRELGKRFIREIKHNTSDYYVDVHNAGFPDGALRGQLTR
jgi:hypothetical protein